MRGGRAQLSDNPLHPILEWGERRDRSTGEVGKPSGHHIIASIEVHSRPRYVGRICRSRAIVEPTGRDGLVSVIEPRGVLDRLQVASVEGIYGLGCQER